MTLHEVARLCEEFGELLTVDMQLDLLKLIYDLNYMMYYDVFNLFV